jgi:hypothetical protein
MVSVPPPTPDSFRSFIQRVQSLRIHSLIDRLDRSELSSRWTEKQTLKTISHYFAFLYLVDYYSNLTLSPTRDIKHVWHCHTLDIEKYILDCQTLFGRVHPFCNLDSLASNRQDLLPAAVLAQVLFRKHFGCPMSAAFPQSC